LATTFAAAAVVAISGCSTASVDEVTKGVGASLGAALESVKPSTLPSANAPSNYPTLLQSEAAGLFKRFPISSDTRPETFPRVAVTITAAGPAVFANSSSAPAKAEDDCITFNLRVWSSERDSKRYDGLRMCSRDRSRDVPFLTINTWSIQSAPASMGETTGNLRGDGPRRPKMNMPGDPTLQRIWVMDRPGIFFVGSVLYQLGYDWDSPLEGRVWFVSLPAKAG
jgi:hypothetical protein